MKENISKCLICILLLSIQDMAFTSKTYSLDNKWELAGPPGGLVSEIAVISNNPDVVVTANQSPFIGLMKRTDDGKSWQILNEGLNYDFPSSSTSIRALAIDLVFPDTMFVSIRSSHSTYEFYKSYNGGENWQFIMEDISFRAIAAKDGRVYASPESGGLLASFDGGENWQDIAPNLPSAAQIVLDRECRDTLYVGTRSDGLYRSLDGGNSFEQIGFPDTTIKALDVVASDTSSLIVVSAGDIFIGNRVYIRLNNGESWIPRNDGLQEYPHNEVLALVIVPDNPNILYAGTRYGMYKTVNQGLNWFPVNEGLQIPTILFPEPEPATILALAMDPNNPNILYAGTDRKGLFKTTNGGEEWSLIGIPATSISGLSVSALNPELIYAGAEDGFYVKRNGRWTPTTLWGGETSGIKSVASSPIDSNLIIASYNNATFMPLIHKSTDGGQTWKMTQMLFDGSDVWNIIFDPIYPERVYGVWCWPLANTGGLIISEDHGDTWEIVELGESIDLAINPENSDELFLLGRSGKVLKSTDRGINWETIRVETDTSHYAIVIDPFNAENLYLGTYGVWKSHDGGNTWTRRNLNKWVQDLAFDEKSGYLYAATYGGGVFFTTDGGDSWDSLEVPSNPYLQVIDIGEGENHSNIYVGSFGTGVFEWSEELTLVSSSGINNELLPSWTLQQNYPNPFNERTLMKFRVFKAAQVSLRIINIRGQIVRTLVNEHKPAGEYLIYWDGRDDAGRKVASGLFHCLLKYGNLSIAKKLVFIK